MGTQLGEMLQWVAAVVAGVAPRRFWPDLERHLPVRRAGWASGVATMLAGFFYGFGGFMTFATGAASANNNWMLTRLAGPPAPGDESVGLVPYGMSVLTLFIYLLFTARGLFASYVVASGLLRSIAASVGDPFGDPILSGLDRAATTMVEKNRRERRQIARERLEGSDAPDLLRTGAWAGLPDDDYVVLAARTKPEWEPGAIILTDSDWYKLGVPFDLQTPAGLRTAYPLKKMDAVEVVRRGIRYDLPPLRRTRQPTSKPETPGLDSTPTRGSRSR